jgi:hypothetical protein
VSEHEVAAKLREETQRRIEASTRLAQARAREARQVTYYRDGDSSTDIALIISADKAAEWMEDGVLDVDVEDIREELEELVRREWTITKEYTLTITKLVVAASEAAAREEIEDDEPIHSIRLDDGWEEEDCRLDDIVVDEDY